MKLRVMADYKSSGIWIMEEVLPGFRHGMISHEALNLPKELSDKFNKWIETKWTWLSKKPSKEEVEEFNRVGSQLAQELKKFLGPEYYVEFESKPGEYTVIK